jgi:hypothetical protein
MGKLFLVGNYKRACGVSQHLGYFRVGKKVDKRPFKARRASLGREGAPRHQTGVTYC